MAYQLDGIEYPSVTTITGMLDKPALLSWAANCAVDHVKEHLEIIKSSMDVHRVDDILDAARKAYATKRDEAASAGTSVHHAIEAHIIGLDPRRLLDCDEALRGYEAFVSWEEKNHVEWLESEVEVFCVSVGYAGRFDAIANVNGHRYLVDFKTSKGIWPEFSWQLCAYRQAYNEMYPQKPVDNLAVLHLDKLTAEPTFKPIEKNIGRMTMLFNTLVSAYYLQSNRRLKNNPFVEAAKAERMPF